MATKRLARSIIELGRGTHGKYERKLRAGSFRRWKLDEDGEYQPGPYRGDGVELRDNLRPLQRWLLSRVNRPWAKVFSEFCEKVGRGSVQGDHIHMHLKQMVHGSGGQEGAFSGDLRFYPPCYQEHGYWSFFIDAKGFLRHHSKKDCEVAGKKAGWAPGMYRYKHEFKSWNEIKAERRAQGIITLEELRVILGKMDARTKADQANPVEARG